VDHWSSLSIPVEESLHLWVHLDVFVFFSKTVGLLVFQVQKGLGMYFKDSERTQNGVQVDSLEAFMTKLKFHKVIMLKSLKELSVFNPNPTPPLPPLQLKSTPSVEDTKNVVGPPPPPEPTLDLSDVVKIPINSAPKTEAQLKQIKYLRSFAPELLFLEMDSQGCELAATVPMQYLNWATERDDFAGKVETVLYQYANVESDELDKVGFQAFCPSSVKTNEEFVLKFAAYLQLLEKVVEEKMVSENYTSSGKGQEYVSAKSVKCSFAISVQIHDAEVAVIPVDIQFGIEAGKQTQEMTTEYTKRIRCLFSSRERLEYLRYVGD
jgi:hypothetical protein